jgi:hypothetical protein
MKRFGIVCKRNLTSYGENVPSFIKGNTYYTDTIYGDKKITEQTRVINELNQPHILGIWYKYFIIE